VNQAYVAFNGGTYEEARLGDWRAIIHPDDYARIVRDPWRARRRDSRFRWRRAICAMTASTAG
jgi:hypothetical protein